MRILWWLAAFAMTAFALAGCSGGGVPAPPKDSKGRYVIHMTAGAQFVPANAQVPKGATVVWVNDAAIAHDVQDQDKHFSSGGAGDLKNAGQEYEFTFTSAGTFHYYCTIHQSSGMTGTITVA